MSNYNGQFQDSSANTLLPTPHSFANIEGATASQAYIKGQMIVFNNRLCEVTSAIASGDTLTVGTNIAYKNVGDIGKQLVATDGTGFYFDVADGKYGFYPSASKVPAEFIPFGGSGLEVQKGAWILMLGNTNTSGAIVRNVLDLSTTAFPYSYTQTFCAAHIIDVTNYSNCVITNSGRVNDVLVFGYDSSGRYLECQYKFTDGGATHNIDVSGYDSVLLVQGMRSSTYSSCTLTLS